MSTDKMSTDKMSTDIMSNKHNVEQTKCRADKMSTKRKKKILADKFFFSKVVKSILRFSDMVVFGIFLN